jgi:hypothetical protein
MGVSNYVFAILTVKSVTKMTKDKKYCFQQPVPKLLISARECSKVVYMRDKCTSIL